MTDDEEVLLRGFTISRVMDCIADPSKNRVIAELWDRVGEVFPYLNAVVPNLMYNPGANTLTVIRGGRILTFYPHLAVMAKVDGEEDAEAQLRWFQELCNDTWRRRAEIEPRYERRQQLGPLDVYRLLPKLNCGDCGERSCMAFAFRLLFGELEPPACIHLDEPVYAEGGERLAELVT
jgi:ArsR family metal-binding transcriptional regulator